VGILNGLCVTESGFGEIIVIIDNDVDVWHTDWRETTTAEQRDTDTNSGVGCRVGGL
jgi:hypothetical protein